MKKKKLLTSTKVFADKTRLRILNVLVQKELCVCEIQGILEMSERRISRHLKILRSANLILERKESKWHFYNLNIKENEKLIDFLKENF